MTDWGAYAAWAGVVVLVGLQWLSNERSRGRDQNRIANLEQRVVDVEKNVGTDLGEVRVKLDNQDRLLLSLVEERGANRERHDSNSRLLESISRRIEAQGRGA